MRIAVLADAKANEPALLAVLAAVDRLHVERVWHIGSLLSYGPDPVAVAERVRQVTEGRYCLNSMFDSRITGDDDLSRFNVHARMAALRSRQQLRPSWLGGRAARDRWSWLRELPAQGSEGSLQLFSGTPLDSMYGVLSTSGIADDELRRELAAVQGCALVGTLGCPGIVRDGDAVWHPIQGEQSCDVSRARCIVCPGAVGQPRDGDPRAGFLLWEDGHFTWYRVAYDVAETQRRILAKPELSHFYAERLALGR